MELPNPQDYKDLFRIESSDITCIHSELLVNGSLGDGDPIVLYHDTVWHSFINKEKERNCLTKGLELFESRERYEAYANSFRTFIRWARENLVRRYSQPPNELTKTDFLEVMRVLTKLWHHYGLTEFSHTELAYEKMNETGNPILADNLQDLSKLKVEGRELINAVIFRDGVIPNIIRSISSTYLKGPFDGAYLYSDELASLFDGKKAPENSIEQRKHSYAIARQGDRLVRIQGDEALVLFKRFTRLDDVKVLHGTVANSGFAKGRAVIAPMLTDPDRINQVAARMRPGDVLVAQSTTPELMQLCTHAAAIVTDQGGSLSHAAIVSRELDIPCIVGTSIATRIFRDGDMLEVNAHTGTVRLVE